MKTTTAIETRRSIRAFKDRDVPRAVIVAILTTGTHAPSAKNRQPWRFVVIQGDKRAKMVRVMRQGIAKCRAAGIPLGSAERSAGIMLEAPVTVFVFHPEGLHPWEEREWEHFFVDVTNVQSIGAAIQNMLLAAFDLGLGSLWICDVFYAYDELRAWLGEPGQMIAAVALGYAAESPAPGPRKSLAEVVRWL